MTDTSYKYVGKRRRLVEGFDKVTGMAEYVGDLVVPRMLYGRPILSPYAHANIVSVDKSAAEAMPGVVAVLTADDLPTKDYMITSRNSAVLAKGKVLFVGQPVVVVVAESESEAAAYGTQGDKIVQENCSTRASNRGNLKERRFGIYPSYTGK